MGGPFERVRAQRVRARQREVSSQGSVTGLLGRGEFLPKETDVRRSRFIQTLYVNTSLKIFFN